MDSLIKCICVAETYPNTFDRGIRTLKNTQELYYAASSFQIKQIVWNLHLDDVQR